MIFELLEFVLYNTYIRFGGDLYKQIMGIPMRGNASPFIADLFLCQLEYKYMMDKNNPNNLKHVLSNNKRYLDDILVLNCKDFIDISKNIYPSELNLEPSHGAGHEDHFLDLIINISDNNKLSLKCIIKQMILILKWLVSHSLKVIYTQISHIPRFSHSYFVMQGFVVIILILKIDVKF